MMTRTDDNHAHEQKLKSFERLVEQVDAFLEQFGKYELLKPGDYSIYEDYWGYPQVKVSMNDLKMLAPPVITGIQQIVRTYPGWEIVIAVTVPAHRDWPEMGLYIRPHEIIDGLQRQYFPKEFQNIYYEGARRGTAYD